MLRLGCGHVYDETASARLVYPNGLQSTFTYDDLNRVTALAQSKNASSLGTYNYTLGQTGNRATATEPSGRALSWTYDGIARLTNETISLDPRAQGNGAVTYGLDPVGNRLSQTSTLSGIPSVGPLTYDADDRLSTETYDANGNTLTTGSRTFTYDFENLVKTMALSNGPVTVTLQYDGDSNRVAKTVGSVITRYLVDDLNPTGYSQVVEELVGTAVQRTYTYGVQRVSQNQLISGTWRPSFYSYDGGDIWGSVRLLAALSGEVTDTYDYDAWGNTVNATGSTPNTYLYRGEQYDPELSLYYLRTRYFNPVTGRFVTTDPFTGTAEDPGTLHKYVYAGSDPANGVDPTGRSTILPGDNLFKPRGTSAPVSGAVTPEAGGYIHMPMFPLGLIHVNLPTMQDRGILWQDPHNPKCSDFGGGASPFRRAGYGVGIKICSRPGWRGMGPGGVMNHVYLWDPERCDVCGQGNESYPGRENPREAGTVCVDIPGSEARGKADQIMNCCEDKAPKQHWLPGSRDCHGLVDKCVKAAGLNPPPHAGASPWNWNGRWGSRCPDPACQWGPWFPPFPRPGPGPWPR